MAQGIGQGKAMLNVMIVDDEPPARARLGQVLRDCSEQVSLQLVGEADGGIQGLEEADRLHPDVILLDVHMPDMNGIEVARHLAQRENPPAVIFVTAYDEHALDAFEVQALDYLMKPVRAERLVAALSRAERFRTHEPRIEELAKTIGAVRSHLTVSERGRMMLVPIDDVVYLRAELKYVTIKTRDARISDRRIADCTGSGIRRSFRSDPPQCPGGTQRHSRFSTSARRGR